MEIKIENIEIEMVNEKEKENFEFILDAIETIEVSFSE